MAGRSAQAPELVDKVDEWRADLADARRQRDDTRVAAAQAYETLKLKIRQAFAAGLSVTPIVDATGLTASRVYQIKAGRRT